MGPFLWPMPPYACYPAASEQREHEPCQVVGLNGRQIHARLNFFVPSERLAHIQVPPARTTMPLRFSQFQSLLLTQLIRTLPVVGGAADGAEEALLQHRPQSSYRVHLVAGGQVSGQTVGHVETPLGLFLFPPLDDTGGVQRLFIPAEVIASAELGERIGQTLVEQEALTLQQVDAAIDLQDRLRRQKLGEVLLTQKVVTAQQLLDAIAQQSKMPMVRIGETLIAMGLITELQLHDALSQQKLDRTVPLGELLVRLGLVTRQDLMYALARKMGYPLVDLDKFPADPDALYKVPFNVAARLRVAPLLLRDGTLVVALEDPSRRNVMAELEFITQCKIVPVLANQSQLEWAIRDAYAKLGADVASVMFTSFPEPELDLDALDAGKLVEDMEKEGSEANEDERPVEQSDNSLVRLVNTMVVEAYTQGVSDIHIECHPGREKLKIRFRKDGVLVPYLELPHNYRSAMVSRIKIMCDLDISEKRKPQDGKINFARYVPQYRLELRVATIPTANGMEDVVMRILSSARPLPLDKLGLSEANHTRLREALERPYGMILCVGPTGSGKTTSLHSALSYINVAERKIWTAEDPIEITQPGLRQVQVNPRIDWTFAKALRAFLRADPDVIMVGEMRDPETAGMGIEASLTGHLVLSTLHTNSAPETITRLLDMGMDPFNFADSLLVVLAQRLVRRLCPACRVGEPAPDDWLDDVVAEYQYAFTHLPGHAQAAQLPPAWQADALRADWALRLGQGGRVMRWHSPGCDACHQTGYKGRAGIHELLAVSRDMRRLIQTGGRSDMLQQQGLLDGMRTLRQDGLEKMLTGVTSLEEVRAHSNA
jgi:type II secretory ATPase GspE/PulE/Tfp pilus assembly ATPase PilB-like protein